MLRSHQTLRKPAASSAFPFRDQGRLQPLSVSFPLLRENYARCRNFLSWGAGRLNRPMSRGSLSFNRTQRLNLPNLGTGACALALPRGNLGCPNIELAKSGARKPNGRRVRFASARARPRPGSNRDCNRAGPRPRPPASRRCRGQGVTEYAPKGAAADEVRGLWAWVSKQLETGK